MKQLSFLKPAMLIIATICTCISTKAQTTDPCYYWVTTGSAGFSAGTANYTAIAIDGSGTPYVVYEDVANSNKATVMKYNGSSWVTVGSAGFSAGEVNYTSIAIDGSGTPYVAYEDFGNSDKATVMSYNGSSWVTVGSAGFSAGAAHYTAIAIDGSGTPYLAYQDVANSYKATVMKYNGSSWGTVGSAGFSAGEGDYISLAIDGSGTPYVAYEDYVNSANVTVMKYNGSSWANVGSAGFTTNGAQFTSIAINGSGTPYVAFQDDITGGKASVKSYNGSSWVTVGSAGFSAGEAEYTSIAIDGSGTPYVVYEDYSNSDKASVMKYNGTSWTKVGSAGFSAGGTLYNAIAINSSGTPYVAYYDAGNSDKATVMQLNTTSITLGGATTVCTGATATVTDATSGGTWASSNTAVGTIGSSGAVTGVSAGTTVITYTYSATACKVNEVFTVNISADAGTISGLSSVNAGSFITQQTMGTGGNWYSANTAVATAGTAAGLIPGGLITGVSAGTAIISYYAVTSGCSSAVATTTVIVAPSLTNACSYWGATGSAGFTAGEADHPSIAIDGSGTPYVVYQDADNDSKATVMKYNGSSWVTVGSAGFSAGIAGTPSIAIDASGTPYVAYSDNANGGHATVVKFDGSSWVTVGSADFSTGLAYYTTIAIDGSGTPYVAFFDWTSIYKATVMKYNGSSWVIVGSAGFSAGEVTTTSIAIDASGTPYVAYMDDANGNGATVMKYNGSSWVTVGSAGFSAGQAEWTSIAIDGSGTPFVAYMDVSNSNYATVMKYNGSNWVTVGSAGFSAGQAENTSIAIDGSGTPYVTYEDYGNADKATLMKYNGSSWVTVGSAGFSAGVAYTPAVAIDGSGTPYVAYTDGSNSYKATVMQIKNASITLGGATAVCTGATATITAATSGGTWTSSNVTIGTISSSGSISGISAGTTVITYTYSATACTVNEVFTVTATTGPGTLIGASPLCIGASATYSDSTGSGAWASSNTGVATVGSTGIVSSVSAGTALISYTASSGCAGTAVAAVTIVSNSFYSVGIDTASAASFCVGGSVNLNAAGEALVFNGSNYVDIPNYSAIQFSPTDQFSVTGWVYVETPAEGHFQGVVTKSRSTGSSWYGVWINSSGYWAFGSTGDNLICGAATTGWHNFALVYDGTGSTKRYLYIDGALSGSDNHSEYSNGTGDLFFGASDGSLDLLSGTVDEVAIFNTALSSSTISTWMNTSITSSHPNYGNLVGYWKLDEGTGTTVHDLSGYASNGTLYNSPAWVASTAPFNDFPGDTYSWSTGATNDTINVSTSGSYSVTVVSAAGCKVTTAKTVTEYPTPSATFTATPNPVCLGSSTVFSPEFDSLYTWNFGDGTSPSSGSSPSHAYSALGVYTVSLSVTSYYGCVGSSSSNVTVETPPATTTISGTSSLCSGSTDSLTAGVSGGAWSSNNTAVATVDATTGVVSGVSAGYAEISYTIATGCASTNAYFLVDIPATATTYYRDYDGDGFGNPSVTTAACSQPTGYVLNDQDCNDSLYNLATWGASGTPGFTAGEILYNSIATNSSGVPYAAYRDYTGNISVRSYGGGSWPLVGEDFAYGDVAYTSIAVDGSGAPWVVFQDAYYSYKATVMKYTGGYFTAVGSMGFSAGEADYTSIAINASGTAYVAYEDYGNSNKATVKKYNGSTWVTVGSVGFSAGAVTNVYLAISGGGTPYVVFADGANSSKATVMDYDGSSWKTVGSAGFSAGATNFDRIAIDAAGNPYVVYQDGGNSGKATVMEFNGASWVTVGAAGFSAGTANFTTLAIDGTGRPFVAFQDVANSNKATVMKDSSGTWVNVGSAGFTPAQADYTAITINKSSGIPYVLISDYDYGQKATVYTVTPKVNNPDITSVTASADSVCAGSSTTLTVSGTKGDGSAWHWFTGSCGGAAVGTGTSVAVSPTVTTTYYVRAEGACITSGSCSNITITVNATAAAITGTKNICIGASTTLSDASTGGTWSGSISGEITVGATTGAVTGISVGTFVVSYGLGNGCASATATLTVSPYPTVSVSALATICNGASATLSASGALTYTWSPATGLSTATGATSTASPAVTTTYSVTGVNGGGCGNSDTVTIIVNPSPTSISGNLGIISTFAGNGGDSYSGDGSPATNATFVFPIGIASDGSGNTYVVDCLAEVVRKINASGIISTFAGNGTVGYSGDGGPATASQLSNPYGVATDAAGNVYIVDNGNSCIRKVNTSGIITTIAGNGSGGYSGDGGIATAAQLYQPNCMAVDHSGNIYISDWNNERIRVINTAGYISTFAGNGTPGFSGDGGAATNAEIQVPCSIAFDAINNMYFVDQENRRVREVTTAGIINTIGGDGTFGNSGDGGAATVAEFGYPYGIAVDGNANIYVSDFNSETIRKINKSGIISTVVGNDIAGYYGDGGPATAAELYNPDALVFDAEGNLLLTDGLNSRIRKVTLAQSSSVCVASSITLTNGIAGGTWTSSHTAVATVDPVSGVVTGIAAGTATISYQLTDGCFPATQVVRVNGLPAAISGAANFCTSATATLTDGTTGGSWSSANTVVATVGSATGVVAGVSGGTAIISYITAAGCYATRTETIVPTPSAVSGSGHLCTGSTYLFTDATTGGRWTSSTGAATVGSSSGMVSGTLTGAATISYTLQGCSSIMAVTVSAAPAIITGAAVDTGFNTTFTDATTGGAWSSGNTTVATVGVSTGIVRGVSVGSAVISYATASGCYSVYTINVSAGPGSIVSGAGNVLCSGINYLFTDVVAGGVWSSSTIAARIGSASGVVTGEISGTAIISYTIGTFAQTYPIHVYITPEPVSGGTVCTGLSTLYSIPDDIVGDGITGGIWTSTNPANATVSSLTGMVSGVAAGTTTISFTNAGYCSVSKTINVYNAPAAISGPIFICTGASYTFSDDTAGGAWSSTTIAAATVSGTTGVATGELQGTTTITYTDWSGCYSTIGVTVTPSPAAVTGGMVCSGASAFYTDVTAGGAWSSGNASIATVNSTGLVTGVAAGTAFITYTMSSGCMAAKATTIIAAPAVISGPTELCSGSSYTFTDATSGGTWSRNNSAVTVGSVTGIVTGALAGASMVSYTAGGCVTTLSVTIATPPAAISGAGTVEVSAATTYGDATTGGAWSSGNVAIAATGTATGATTSVRGVATGTTVITYTLSTGCFSTHTIAVVPFTGRIASADSAQNNNASLPEENTGHLQLLPNPNNGTFVLTGETGEATSQDLTILVTDMLGRQVYENATSTIDGKINTTIQLSSTLPNGMYIVNLQSGTFSKAYRFTVLR